jgi:hypothetical protein
MLTENFQVKKIIIEKEILKSQVEMKIRKIEGKVCIVLILEIFKNSKYLGRHYRGQPGVLSRKKILFHMYCYLLRLCLSFCLYKCILLVQLYH